MEVKNYYDLTSEQLWDQLRKVDTVLKALNEASPLMIELIEDLSDCKFAAILQQSQSRRMRIINAFIEEHGYNPDNLCTTSAQTTN